MSPAAHPVILIVDDEEPNRRVLVALLQAQGYRTAAAASGEAALDAMTTSLPDLILLDLGMPGLGGLATLRRLKGDARLAAVPTIIVTGMADRSSRIAALEEGAEDYLTKPVDSKELTVRVRNHLRLKEYNDVLREQSTSLERQVAERTATLAESYRETIYLLSAAAEHRDEDTGAHIRRVSRYASCLATALGLPPEIVDCVFYASPLHDIGKIGIPDGILLKPGPLTTEEWVIMRRHTSLGRRILERGSAPYLRMGAEIAQTHHERWDGSGYPDGLRGEQIPQCGRIMAIADQYDALRSARPYKPALPHTTTVKILTEGDGRTHPGHFCPRVLEAFRRTQDQFESVFADVGTEP